VFEGARAVVHLVWGFQPTRNTRYLDAVGIAGSRAVCRTLSAGPLTTRRLP
jgi:hypothetical protein